MDFEAAEKSRREENVHPAHQHLTDEKERVCFNAPPFKRLIDNKFREQGFMLPFGYQTKDFIVPNP
jgi:hypothetical protein